MNARYRSERVGRAAPGVLGTLGSMAIDQAGVERQPRSAPAAARATEPVDYAD